MHVDRPAQPAECAYPLTGRKACTHALMHKSELTWRSIHVGACKHAHTHADTSARSHAHRVGHPHIHLRPQQPHPHARTPAHTHTTAHAQAHAHTHTKSGICKRTFTHRPTVSSTHEVIQLLQSFCPAALA